MSDSTFERAVNEWLEDGSDRTPRHAIDGVLLAIKTTPQQRDLRIPWRFAPMNPIARLAAVAAVAIVAVAGSLYMFGRGPSGPGGGPTPRPTAPPTASPTQGAVATITPAARTPLPALSYSQSHTSEIYHYSTRFPSTWTLAAGTRPGESDFIPDIGTGLSDFYGDHVASGVMVTSAPVSAARPDLATWTPFITNTIKRQYGRYIGLGACSQSSRTLTVAGEPANEVDFICPANDWLYVTAVHAGRAYQIAWLDDGGFDAAYLRPFLDEFLGTFAFTK